MLCALNCSFTSLFQLMSDSLLRPRYKISSQKKAAELRAMLLEAVKSSPGFEQRSLENHVLISLPRKDRHFWSPTLDINFEEESESTTVRILIGPAPAVWTFFMFGYSLAGLSIIAGLILGYSQYILGQNSWTFIFAPVGIFLAGGLLLASLAGKYKAQNEMQRLKIFVEFAIGQELLPRPREEN